MLPLFLSINKFTYCAYKKEGQVFRHLGDQVFRNQCTCNILKVCFFILSLSASQSNRCTRKKERTSFLTLQSFIFHENATAFHKQKRQVTQRNIIINISNVHLSDTVAASQAVVIRENRWEIDNRLSRKGVSAPCQPICERAVQSNVP